MLRDHAGGFRTLLLLFDVGVSALIFLALLTLPDLRPLAVAGPESQIADARLLALGLVVCLTWPLLLQQSNLYTSLRTQGLGRVFGSLTVACGLSVMILSAAAFLLHAPVEASFPISCGLAQFAALGSSRLIGFGALRIARRGGANYRNVLVIGTGPRADYVRRVIERRPQWGLRILGYVDERDTPLAPGIPVSKIHKLADVESLLRDEVIDEVIVACPRTMLQTLVPLVDACGSAGVPVTLLSDLFGDYLPPPRVTRFDSLAALSFAPVHHGRVSLGIKRGVDVVGALVAMMLTAPILGLAALAIKLSSSGPIFFRQVRCGLHGRRFEMLKLRTMVMDAEERKAELLGLNEMDGPVFKMECDPRITRVGQLLRRYSLDEIPQLWNVLLGHMSLVGPRPPVPLEVAQYETSERRRLSMRPGITCLWQVSGRNRIGFHEWVKLDLEYIDSWSLGKDLRILFRTLPAVLRGTGV